MLFTQNLWDAQANAVYVIEKETEKSREPARERERDREGQEGKPYG